jgi:UMF1 family MFS transporter
VAFFCGENLIAGFLPELAAKEEMGRLSGLGWTIGYFGGLLSLAAALPFATEALTPWTCLTTAVFFAVAGLPTFLFLKERAVPLSRDHCERLVRMAFGRTLDTWRERRIWRDLFTFLVSILLFQGGVAVVIAFSAIYAEQDMGLSKTEVILLFLALQIAAALGAWSFGRLQDHFGSKPTLILAIGLWMAAVLGVWLSQGPGLFVAASVLAGIAMGSSQSASRALVGLFCPYGREAEWFGLWGLATKGAACLGLLLFIGLRTLGDRRESLLSATVLLFACGLIVLLKVDVERGRKAAIEQGRAASFPGER